MAGAMWHETIRGQSSLEDAHAQYHQTICAVKSYSCALATFQI